MTKRAFAWSVMMVLAIAIAGYASAVMIVSEFRPPLVRTLFAERPIIAVSHFTCGAISLVAGAFQLNTRLRTGFIRAHRWLGRLYLLAVGVGGTAGFTMALQSLGGPAAHAGFGLLAIAWLASTLIAYRYILQRNFDAHRSWMIRSYALTLAAVTLRLYIPLSQIAGIPFEAAYPVIAWLCWVPNLAVAEWFVRSRYDFAMLPNAR
jgi:hypothetical protein